MADKFEALNGATTLLPTTTWAAPNGLFGAADVATFGSWADATSIFTTPSSSLPDGILFLWGFEFEDTSNGRHNPQGRMVQASGTGDFASAVTGGYNRDNSEDRSYVSGWSFVKTPSASSTYQFQWRRDTDAPTGGTVRSFIQAVPIYFSDAAVYTSTSTTATGGTTPVQITGLTGTDGANISLSSNTANMTADNKWHLCLGSGYHQGVGNARTQRWFGFRVDGTKDDSAKGCMYYRNAANADGGESFIKLIKTSTATRTVDLFQYRGDGVAAGQGGADVDGNVTGSNSQHALVVIEFNASAEAFSSVDSVGGQEFALAGPVDVDVASTADIEDNDAAAFTRSTDTAVNCEKAMDLIAFANVSHARGASSIGSGSRWTVHGEFTINGTEQTDKGFHGNYNRGNQGSQDCMGSSCNMAGAFTVAANDDIGCSNQELAGTEGGAGDIEAPAGWVGFGLINLDSLQAVASSDPSITDVETDEEFRDGDTSLTITGADFEAVQGTGLVEIAAESTYAAATTKISQTVTSWGDTTIDFTALLDTLTPGANYLYVTNDTGDTNANGFAITIHRKIAFEMSLSSNFTDGSATTDRGTNGISAPAGGSTFLAGIIRESTNEFTINLGTNQWTHIAACIQATVDAIDDGVYVFEVVESDGTALDTYSQTLEITVAEGQITGVVTDNAAASAAFGVVIGYRASITEGATAQDTKTGVGAYRGEIIENAIGLDSHTAIAHYLGGIVEGIDAGDTPNSIKRIVDTLLANAVAGESLTEILTAIAAIQEGIEAGEDWANDISFITDFLGDALASDQFAVLIEMFGAITEDAQASMLLEAILTAVANIDEQAEASDLFQSFTEASNDLLENAVAGFTVTNVLSAIAAIVEAAQASEEMEALLTAAESFLANATATFTLTDLYSAVADFDEETQASALMSSFVTSITELTENVNAGDVFIAEVIGALAGAFSANTVASNNFNNSIQALANLTANGNALAAFTSLVGLLSSFSSSATAQDVYVYNIIFAGMIVDNVNAIDVYESYVGLIDGINFNAIALDTFIATEQAIQLQFSSTAIAGAIFSLAGGGLLKAAVSIAVALQALTHIEPSLKSSISVVEALNSLQNVEQSAKASVSTDSTLKGTIETND